MKKTNLTFVYIFMAFFAFSQAQSQINVINFMGDFAHFDAFNFQSDDAMRFHNVCGRNSPIDFYTQSSDVPFVSINTTPFSYIQTRNVGQKIELSNIFGHLKIGTHTAIFEVTTIISSEVYIQNLVSELTIIKYNEDYYIDVHSGKINICLPDNKILILSGQKVLLHPDLSWDILPFDFDSDIYKHQVLSKIMVNKNILSEEIENQLRETPLSQYDQYIKLYVLSYFYKYR